ncbi:MAG TPA: flagellar export chaperone FliS [Burkholderiaceae bacterium]|jgi:flagellar protein FliS|nr:flagellar export chaperone FliS [Burkholderiaceae bacterium]
MFSAPTYNTPGRNMSMSRMYQQVDVEAQVLSATPHRLVTMLYDGLLEALNRARGALQAKDIPTKAQAITRAARIVDEGLKAGIVNPGGSELATNLHALYVYISMRLMHANLHNDDAALQECIRLITPLREAWVSIGAQVDVPPRGNA